MIITTNTRHDDDTDEKKKIKEEEKMTQRKFSTPQSHFMVEARIQIIACDDERQMH